MAERAPTAAEQKISVLIVDDHPIMRDGLARLFAFVDDIVVVGEAGSGEEALRLARSLLPRVVLLDINLPQMNGLQVTVQLKAKFRNQIGIILLTAHDNSDQIVHAMRAGASAYCSKEIEIEKLIDTIRQVVRGNFVIEGKVYNEHTLHEWLNSQIEALSGPYLAESGEHFFPLSPREMEILRCVTRGLSNKEIAVELGISHQTVKNHMTSILDKLNVEDRTQAAVYALQRGWVRMIKQGLADADDD